MRSVATRARTHPAILALFSVGVNRGAEDLVASLGGTSSRIDETRTPGVALHTRSSVLLVAGAYSRAVIDVVYLDIAYLEGLGAEARANAALGFTATACIHLSLKSRYGLGCGVQLAQDALDVFA